MNSRRLLGFLLLPLLFAPRAAAEEGGGPPVLGDLYRASRNTAADLWHVTSAPARMDRGSALAFAGFAAATGLIYAYDEDILDWVDRNREEDLYDAALEPGRRLEPLGHMGNTMAYYLGSAALTWYVERDRLFPVFADLVESHAIAGLYKNASNVLIGRSRPFEERGPYFFKYDSGTSFPSGHASNIFQIAVVLSHHVGWKPFSAAAYTLAASVALERLDSRSHWPSDVWVGAVYGVAVAKSVVARNEERRASRRTALVPSALPVTGGPAVALSLSF